MTALTLRITALVQVAQWETLFTVQGICIWGFASATVMLALAL